MGYERKKERQREGGKIFYYDSVKKGNEREDRK
jgi:hypothetical protein